SPVLHITSQIDRPWMDRDRAAIHDVPRQADMLRAVSKAYFRVWDGRTAVGMVVAGGRRRAHPHRGAVAELLRHARRPMLWLGGGARDAGGAALDLAERGFAVVSSTNGRAVV